MKILLINRLEFLKEANTMKEFQAYHVVRLIGVVSQHEKPLVVMEFMSNGDLKNFLKNNRPEVSFNWFLLLDEILT